MLNTSQNGNLAEKGEGLMSAIRKSLVIAWVCPAVQIIHISIFSLIEKYAPKWVCEYYNQHEYVCGPGSWHPFLEIIFSVEQVIAALALVVAVYLLIRGKLGTGGKIGLTISVLLALLHVALLYQMRNEVI